MPTLGPGIHAIGSSSGGSTVAALKRWLVASWGESNSGGYADNIDLGANELQPRAMDILKVGSTPYVFEPMQTGVNNNLDHSRLDSTTHGYEVGLANMVEADDSVTVDYVQTGQGGSRLANWRPSQPWFTERRNRILTAKQLRSWDHVAVWCSIGINNAIDGTTSPATYNMEVRDNIAAIRELLPTAVFVFTSLPVENASTQHLLQADYNAELAAIAADLSYVAVADTTGAPFRDSNHWNAVGMKIIATRMWAASQSLVGA